MNIVRKILSSTAGVFDLPADALAGVPRLEMVGFSECSIEPHKGLKEYGEQEIVVDSCVGPIRISGEKLYVKRMNHQRITVCGVVRSVDRWEDNGNA